jgi:hypothetical protein|tara:strand:+ start:201 stop:1673 length:1473 start_codon:yes stop_codon:yes gene_type:complete
MADSTDHKSFITSFAKHLNPGKIPFLEFANEAMMEYMSHEPDEFHPLADMHKNWHDTIAENERVAIICARGHLKTSFSLTYLLWQMYSNPNFRALYIGNTFTQVVDKLTQFEELCRRSWRVAPLIPSKENVLQNDVRWNMTQKGFANGSRVRGAVMAGAMEGPHVHLIILDDVLEEFPRIKDDKIINFMNRVVLPMRLPKARIMLIGTQKRPDDITAYVKENPYWNTIWHPALKDDGTPRWPEYWTIDRLEEERLAMGTRAFESEYMLNPIDPDSAVIPWSVIEPCLNNGLEMFSGPIKGWVTVMGVDLAVGFDTQHDETAYCVLAYNPKTEQRKVLHQWSGKIQGEGASWLNEQITNISKIASIYNPEKIMIESNGFQRLVAHAARDVEKLPIATHHTGNERNHAQIGIPGIAVAMEKGLYEIPFSDTAKDNTRPGTRDLVKGLTQLMWDGKGKLEGHVADTVISLWMCELAIEERERKKLNMTNWTWL